MKHLSELIERIVKEYISSGYSAELNQKDIAKICTLVSQETMKAVRVGKMKEDRSDHVRYGHDFARAEQRWREKEWQK
jgi:hypothetical protein